MRSTQIAGNRNGGCDTPTLTSIIPFWLKTRLALLPQRIHYRLTTNQPFSFQSSQGRQTLGMVNSSGTDVSELPAKP